MFIAIPAFPTGGAPATMLINFDNVDSISDQRGQTMIVFSDNDVLYTTLSLDEIYNLIVQEQ